MGIHADQRIEYLLIAESHGHEIENLSGELPHPQVSWLVRCKKCGFATCKMISTNAVEEINNTSLGWANEDWAEAKYGIEGLMYGVFSIAWMGKTCGLAKPKPPKGPGFASPSSYPSTGANYNYGTTYTLSFAANAASNVAIPKSIKKKSKNYDNSKYKDKTGSVFDHKVHQKFGKFK
jgi:hypothetical protein